MGTEARHPRAFVGVTRRAAVVSEGMFKHECSTLKSVAVNGVVFAVLLGAFVGLAVMLDHAHVPVNALAPMGAIGAALVALWIATRDRQERKQEEADARKAQASLVVVEIERQDGRDPNAPWFNVLVRNVGSLSILKVELTNFEHPWVELSHEPPLHLTIPPMAGERFRIMPPTDGQTQAAVGGHTAEVTATARFDDAYGNRWERSSSGSLVRVRTDRT